MKESLFGFEYTWADLQPIRALTVVVIMGQIIGGALGVLIPPFSDWFKNVWFGGAVVTFPAFLLGLGVQARVKPGSIKENCVMVRRFALVAAFLTVIALAVPLLGLRFGKGSP